eukprot:CAMPEP_0178697684 /NCGR_PEP_ID=MMETSP0699-20121125/10126_1 /TAXON_ID=265572 /ORGANISM="Extubocellulus spinifer, Strain CCMP396" /LENGTH=34 /DNA_ID= /DNA_START= /DNA_END= /DNA_ORIENTATION=
MAMGLAVTAAALVLPDPTTLQLMQHRQPPANSHH